MKITSHNSKQIWMVLGLSLAISIGACKQKEEVVVLATSEPIEEIAEIEEEIKIPQDSLKLHYQRTACFGTCPIFLMKVYASGYATYEGTNFVENMGKFDGRVPAGAIESVVSTANGIGYFQMQNRYDAMVSDLPSVITEIADSEGIRKRVDNRYDGPKQLHDLYPILDHIIEATEWKPIKKQ